jgi:hypothetical protein
MTARKSQDFWESLNIPRLHGAIGGMRWLLFGLFSMTASCSLLKEEPAESTDSEAKPRLVGRIALVPRGGGFVLIESYGPWRVPEGGLLSSVGTEGRTSNLVVTGEKLGQHAAADLRSGLAKVGDSVYYRPLGEESGDDESVVSPPPVPSTSEIKTKKDLTVSP